MRFLPSIIIVFVCLLGVIALATKPKTSAMDTPGLGILLKTDKAIYSSYEPIMMYLHVFNSTEKPITFEFSNTQRYDFILKNKEGKEIWRWSKDRMFGMMLGEERLEKGHETLAYKVKYEGKLSPGMYQLTGLLVAKNRPMSASLSVLVE